jgi:hypothetical protein
VVLLEDWIDHRPSGLDCVLTSKERSIADHGVAQEPLVGRFLPRPLFEKVELALLAHELLASELKRAARATAEFGDSRKRR